jgi:hypothetical protein
MNRRIPVVSGPLTSFPLHRFFFDDYANYLALSISAKKPKKKDVIEEMNQSVLLIPMATPK